MSCIMNLINRRDGTDLNDPIASTSELHHRRHRCLHIICFSPPPPSPPLSLSRYTVANLGEDRV